jgi:ATP phosphoribosyltransferase regulatory subunit
MNKDVVTMFRDEEYLIGLRRLFESFGYKKFKMRKFENYELYLENKSFLRSGNIITVTGPKGRLLAIKPDVTLSIVKNVREDMLPAKYYYNESVYIADSSDGSINESTQVGLEYIGDLDIRALAEILLLASESLARVGDDYLIAISHMSFVSDILVDSGIGESECNAIINLISEKNLHGIRALCSSLNVNDEITERICSLAFVCGEFREEIKNAERFVCGDSSRAGYDELVALSAIIDEFGLSDRFILDFSLMNDMNYYNGLVFKGFVESIPTSILSGGQYDLLMKKMDKPHGAIGFAVYPEYVAELYQGRNEYDVDAVILYTDDADIKALYSAVKLLTDSGKSVMAQKSIPEKLRYKQLLCFKERGVEIVEDNA